MPREPVDHGRIVYVVPPDFPERLELLQEESGLPWAEIARRLGTYPYTVWRWYRGRARPHFRHQMALLDLADELGLAHLLTAWTLPDETQREKPAKASRPGARVLGGKPRVGEAAATAGAETQRGRRTRTTPRRAWRWDAPARGRRRGDGR